MVCVPEMPWGWMAELAAYVSDVPHGVERCTTWRQERFASPSRAEGSAAVQMGGISAQTHGRNKTTWS